MAVFIGSTFGYMRLDSWVMSKIIQLATMSFCRRFLNYQNDPCRRQFDQTTLAARSVAANIVEGSSRHDTSRETELKLLDVSRASISEVLDDFMFSPAMAALPKICRTRGCRTKKHKIRLWVPRNALSAVR